MELKMLVLAMISLVLYVECIEDTSHMKYSMKKAMEDHVKICNFVSSFNSSSETPSLRVRVCQELLNDALENLKEALERLEVLGNSSWSESDVEWIRGKLTYVVIDHETCFDGFEEMDFLNYRRSQDILKIIRGSLKRGRDLVSRSLAMLTRVRNDLSKHGLLAVEDSVFPKWFGSEDEKSLFNCDLTPNVTVAEDGSGDYKTITEAVNSSPPKSISRFFIHVKEGLYVENVVVSKDKPNIYMYGDGNTKTIVSGSLNRLDKPGFTTFQTATFSVSGRGFVVKDMKFINTAGPEKNQAVAFHSRASESVMYRCVFEGYQDTLYAQAGQQFYRECNIIGTVDFIFGYASAVFQKCNILPRIPLSHQYDTVTAQSSADPNSKSGFSIISCTISPYEVNNNFTAVVYLGRPWKPFSTVVIMKTFLGQFVDPKGWILWNNDPPPATLSYGEYRNYGPGSVVDNRINWIGFKPKMSDQEAQMFSVDRFVNHLGWLNQTCVPYDGSL